MCLAACIKESPKERPFSQGLRQPNPIDHGDAAPGSRRRIGMVSVMNAQKKVAVITGASQGIGAALVTAYRSAGYRVVANSRSIGPNADSGVLTVAGDIADPQVAKQVIAEGF